MTDASGTTTLAGETASFDHFGVPQSADAAYSMTAEQIRETVLRVVAFNEGCDVDDLPGVFNEAEDGSLELDSVQAVFAAAAFSTGFGTARKLVNLARIPQKNWTSVESVTRLLVKLITDRRAGE